MLVDRIADQLQNGKWHVVRSKSICPRVQKASGMEKVCGGLIDLFHLKHKEVIRIRWIGKAQGAAASHRVQNFFPQGTVGICSIHRFEICCTHSCKLKSIKDYKICRYKLQPYELVGEQIIAGWGNILRKYIRVFTFVLETSLGTYCHSLSVTGYWTRQISRIIRFGYSWAKWTWLLWENSDLEL